MLAAAVAAAALWAGWWWLAAAQEEAATRDWFEERREAGWLAELGEIEVSGFPLSYRQELREPALADPATGWAWDAPALVLSRPRQISPYSVTIDWAEAQNLRSPTTRVDVTSDLLRAELTLEGSERLVRQAEITVQGLAATSDAGWQISLDNGVILATADPEEPNVVELAVTAEGWTPPAPLLVALNEAEIAPGTIGRMRIEASAAFDQPWSAAALEERRPQPEWIDISDAGVSWGALDLRIAGKLQIAKDGEVTGELLLKATNWREMIAAGQASGALSETVARGMEHALELASRLAGSTQTLDISLSFVNGRTRLGRVPIAAAPRIVLP